MRTIKFRGKVADVNEWVCGYLGGEDKIYQTEERKGCKCGVGVFRVEPNTVGQFTGLYDKYGEEIYEGDIISFDDGYETESGYCEQWGCIGKVFWDEETAAFYVTDRLSCESYEALADCEVIGNIYDNPELLKVEE